MYGYKMKPTIFKQPGINFYELDLTYEQLSAEKRKLRKKKLKRIFK